VGDYTRFGRSMTYPLFSGFGGFWDGIYSTLWGDGLCGGTGDLALRPPWNYQFMVSGYLLALVPTLMLLCGAVAAIRRFLAKPSSDQFVPLAFFGAVAFGLLFMSLKVPVYGQVKAFYGLGALLTLCLFGAMGWEVLTRGRKSLQFALGTVLIVWAMNSFASMWIRNGTASAHMLLGIGFLDQEKTEAALSEFDAAANAEPANAEALYLLVQELKESKRVTEALDHASRAVELNPMNSKVRVQLGTILASQNQMERAIAQGRSAVKVGPEYVLAHQSLATWLAMARRNDEGIDAAREGLAESPCDPVLHFVLGMVHEDKGDRAAAITQLTYAVLLRPEWAEAHLDLGITLIQAREVSRGLRELEEGVRLAPDDASLVNEAAWVLATFPDAGVRNGPEAARLAEHACVLSGDKDPKLLKTLAAAYAEAGRYPDAIGAARKAVSLAQSSGNQKMATVSQEMLRLFESNRPYRQNPTPPR
jgi:tetratricopeptide (TPR) repeat protein